MLIQKLNDANAVQLGLSTMTAQCIVGICYSRNKTLWERYAPGLAVSAARCSPSRTNRMLRREAFRRA
jgi:hypothetical protein